MAPTNDPLIKEHRALGRMSRNINSELVTLDDYHKCKKGGKRAKGGKS